MSEVPQPDPVEDHKENLKKLSKNDLTCFRAFAHPPELVKTVALSLLHILNHEVA